jgi:hypothetical protein
MKIDFVNIKKEIAKSNLYLDYDLITSMPVAGVYHIHEWDHGYVSGPGYNGRTRREFYLDLNEMLCFLQKYAVKRSISEFIVAPFHNINAFDVCDVNVDVYNEIKQFFKSYGVQSNSQAGVKLSIKENRVLEMILEGNFRGVSKLSILFPERKVLVYPTHHMDLVFFAKNLDEEKNIVHALLNEFINLKYYEKH